MSQPEEVFRVKRRYAFLRWFIFLLVFPATLVIPVTIATNEQPYPDLNILLISYSILGFIWVMLLVEFGQKNLCIELYKDKFLVKKCWQKARHFSYQSILNYNERPSRIEPFRELTIYLKANWFIIRSNEFTDYDYIKNQLTHYAQPVPYQSVITLSERNRLRFFIGGLSLLIIANIIFGYKAYNPVDKKPAKLTTITNIVDKKPAKLTTITNIVDKVSENRVKGNLKGLTLQLHNWPALSFYINRRNYKTDIRSLKQAIAIKYPITLLVRESDYRKKLMRAEPLSFGDKYDNYKQVMVFGVDQGESVHIQASESTFEPTHTNPLQRTFLLGILLLSCWTGWIYIDRHKILQVD